MDQSLIYTCVGLVKNKSNQDRKNDDDDDDDKPVKEVKQSLPKAGGVKRKEVSKESKNVSTDNEKTNKRTKINNTATRNVD